MANDDTKASLQRALEALSAAQTNLLNDAASAPASVHPSAADAAQASGPVETDSNLAAALRETWLELWYQPKIDLRQRSLAGAEALARIRHPERGILLPRDFLPGVDEDTLSRLTEHALLTVLREWADFEAIGVNLRLSINLPINQLLGLPIAQIVNENRPSASHWAGLIVEVSEDQIVREIKQAQEVATELRASGITVSIDDFGAGYSSFSSLRDLAFAELKLNHSFVKDCATDVTNAAICQTAIDLAHRFGSAAVAEGIETMADLQGLAIMGCDFGQGILLAPPMPKDKFIALLQSRMNRPRAEEPPVAEEPVVAEEPTQEPPLAAAG